MADPGERIEAIGGTPTPSIPCPRDLFQPERLNSAGMDLDDRDILAIVQAKVRAEVAVEMPAPDNGEAAVDRAVAAFPDWSGRPVETRAGCLARLAAVYVEIGRVSWRERVCQYGLISVVGVV